MAVLDPTRDAAVTGAALSDRRASAWLLGFLAVLAGVYFLGVARGESFFRIDFHQTFVPLRATLGAALRDGAPLWDRRLNNGTPLLANPMHAVMYPPNLLFAWFPAARLLTLLTVAHVGFAACGVFLLSRAWNLRPTAAFVAAVAYGFNGAALSAIPYANLCWSQAWMPWLLLAWTRAADKSQPRRGWSIAALALVAACMLSLAEPVILLAGALSVAFFAAERLFRDRNMGLARVASRLWGGPLAALVVAALVVSPFLVAVFNYVPECERATGFWPGALVSWSMHPLQALGLLVPGIYGDPLREGIEGFWATKLVPKGHLMFAGLYVGGLLMGLAGVGALTRRERRWPLLAWLGLSLLLALGRWGPIYPWLISLPFMEMVRYPIKWLLVAMLPLSLLAGFGLDSTAAGGWRGYKALWVALLVLSVVPVFVAASTLPERVSWLVSLSNEVGPAGNGPPSEMRRWILDHVLAVSIRALLALAAAVLLLIAARRRPWLTNIGLPALVVLDLLTANAGVAPTVPSSFFDDPPLAIESIKKDSVPVERVYIEAPLIARLRQVPPPRTRWDRAMWERAASVGYVGAAYDLNLAFNLDVGNFRSLNYARLHSMILSAPMRPKLMLLGASGVTHLVTYGNYQSEHLEVIDAIHIGADRLQVVARNHLAVPRVRVVPTLLPHDGERGFMLAVDAAADDLFRRTALVDRSELARTGIRETDLAAVLLDGPPAVAGRAAIVEDRGGTVRIHVVGSGGYVVVNDTWTAGWRASVDGKDKPVLLVDYAFRAVAVPPGDHEVVFRFGVW